MATRENIGAAVQAAATGNSSALFSGAALVLGGGQGQPPPAAPAVSPGQVAAALDLQRAAAMRAAADMGTRQTVGRAAPASNESGTAAGERSDGMVDPYTRMQGGRVVQVGGYALPARSR